MAPCKPYASELSTSENIELYENGSVAACSIVAPCIVETQAGKLTPQYSTDDLRKKTLQAVSFYRSGALRSLPLETQSPVLTPIGEIAAELVTFYESGAVKRVFPLNGKLSGYWGEDDEMSLSENLTIEIAGSNLTARCINISFYEHGSVESITLWPKENVLLKTPIGEMQIRTGIKFSHTGKILSVEPAVPTSVETSIGKVTAYDNDVVGIIGDNNSLVFSENGDLRSITTMHTKVVATALNGKKSEVSPATRESLCGNEDKEFVPMVIEFLSKGIRVTTEPGGSSRTFSYDEYDITSQTYHSELETALGLASSCSM
ncbi:hypothetical protein [Halodesulfovibrio sp. MK-HDV]|uniref:hypothetical protein n=1 Tax=Halodesulfovibrio sp. MK-HDV TaxID=2599925 RepID=UPI00136C9456|nr:hypothetical protein [Halodesulfovibrio sp. MK-HDV]KAF1077102.1 hypothetical protein MKHDV_00701 [Halodesulfovibrio sp. MK-HDV]